MNPQLKLLNPYPFERLNAMLADAQPNEAYSFIALSLGEPKHPAPQFLIEAFTEPAMITEGFGTYPPTRGLASLREAIAAFINRRFGLVRPLNPDAEILPVNGTREALFAIAQTVVDSSRPSVTLMPNPFYQIYEGAAILAGSEPRYVPCTQTTGFSPDFATVSEADWEACDLVYICTPGNPSGAVMSSSEMQWLIRQSDKYDFVIASDECYSEIYQNSPPTGLLQAASDMGRHDYRNCVAFNSLSKRSNLPGLRSGYVAGDATIIDRFLLYRTYHGSAMSVHNQKISELAWRDEQHVEENRQRYVEKFAAVLAVLANVWPMTQPAAGFYLWPETPVDDEAFTRRLLEQTNIKVLPGSYLSRTSHGVNPGSRRVRMALVAELDECVEAAQRIRNHWHTLAAL